MKTENPMICSKSKLDSELEQLKMIFLENGFPENVISVYIKEKLANFSAAVKSGQQKCQVYLKLPWIGNSSLQFESQIKQVIINCFFAVNPRIFYNAKRPFHPLKRIALSMSLRASVILAT